MGSADWGAPPGTPTLSTTWQTISTNPRVAMSVKTVKRPSYYRYTNPDPPHTPPFEKGYVLDHLANGSAQDKLELGNEAAKGGLGIVTAAIFLSGEMAGSGVLALPTAFLGTGGILALVSISLTLYGGGCVFIVLISQLLGSLLANAGLSLSLCVWMVIVAAVLTPLTWAGTPKDFWPIAVGALVTTCVACTLIIVTCVLDGFQLEESVELPAPTYDGIFKAFGSIMFAFAGASTFPTIQADMADRGKFNITAFPIITNPPAQFFEQLLKIPSSFNWKRCMFRSLSVFGLLFIAECVPSFGSILDLV